MATLTKAIATGSDDAHESQDASSVSFASSYLNCAANTALGSRWISGFRFTGITIAGGSTINSATVGVEREFTSSAIRVECHCEAADNAVTFDDAGNSCVDRSLAGSGVDWIGSIGGGENTSENFGTQVALVTGHGGWSSGNAIVVLLKGKDDSTQACYLSGFEDSTEQEAQLDLDYTVPSLGATNMLLLGVGG